MRSLLVLPLALATISASASAQDATGATYAAAPITNVSLARGVLQDWRWSLPNGKYLAFARINFTMHANGGQNTPGSDARLHCNLNSDLGTYDGATAMQLPDLASMQGIMMKKENSGTMTLVATASALSGPVSVRLTCWNSSIGSNALPIQLGRITVFMTPVSSLQEAPLAR